MNHDPDLFTQPLPPAASVAARVLRRTRGEQLLPLRTVEKGDARPANLPLSTLAQLEAGQTGFVACVLRGLDEHERRALAEEELRENYGLAGRGLALPELFRPTWMLLGAATRMALGLGLRTEKKPAPAEPKDRVERIKESKGGKARVEKSTRRLFASTISAGVLGDDGVTQVSSSADGEADRLAAQLVAAFDPDRSSSEGDLAIEKADPREALAAVSRSTTKGIVATADELAAVFAPPDGKTDTSGLALRSTAVPMLPAPAWMRTGWEPGLIRLGIAQPGTDRERVVSMHIDELSGSAYVTGRSGSGKSSWLQGVLRDICLSPYGAALCLDPNATLNQNTLKLLAREHPEVLERERVIAIEWGSLEHPVYWNPLVARDEDEVELAVKTTMILIAALNVGSLDDLPQGKGYLEAAVRNLADANLAVRQAAIARGDDPEEREYLTPYDLRAYLNPASSDFRDLVMRFASRDVLTRFEELGDEKERRATFKSLLHRLDTMVNNPRVALAVDSPRNRIDWKQWISGGYTVLHSMNVLGAKGEAAKGLMPTLLAQAFLNAEDAWDRAGQPEPHEEEFQRLLHAIVADEAQNLAEVAGNEMARALEMLRKCGTRLLLASQFQRQMEAGGSRLAENIRSNIAHRLSFNIPSDEGRGIEAAAVDRGARTIDKETLSGLPDYHLVAAMNLRRPDGQNEKPDPFVAKSVFEPPAKKGDADFDGVMERVAAVFERGRRLHTRPRAVAEDERRVHPERIQAELRRALSANGQPATSPRPSAIETQEGEHLLDWPVGAEGIEVPGDDLTPSLDGFS